MSYEREKNIGLYTEYTEARVKAIYRKILISILNS